MKTGRVILEIVFVATLSILLNLVLLNIEVPYYDQTRGRNRFADVDYSGELTVIGIIFMLLILIWEWIQRKNRRDSRSVLEKYLYFIGVILVFISIVLIGRFFLLDY